MSPARPPLLSTRRRTTLLVLASLIAIGVLLLRFWPGPERLLDLSYRRFGYTLTVLDGELYYQEARPDIRGLVIRAVPVRGGKPRLVLRDSTLSLAGDVEVTRQGIYYRVREVLPPPPGGVPLGGGVPGVMPNVTTLSPPGAGDPREGAPLMGLPPTTSPQPREVLLPRRARVHLWHAPLQGGGAPRELLPEIRALDVRVSGGYCYWMRSKLLGPGPPLRVPVDQPPTNELMVSPLGGGPAHRIALGVETLWVDSGSAFWRVRQRERRTLVSTSPPDFSLRVLDGFTGEAPPIQLNGRLYWLAGASAPRDRSQHRTHQVASSRPDGTDFQVLLDVDPQLTGQAWLEQLQSYETNLLYYQVTAPRGTRPAAYSLHRLRPGASRPESLTTMTSNAGGAVCRDGPYAYFLRSELRENWLDWSADGLIPRRLSVLYRVPVAE